MSFPENAAKVFVIIPMLGSFFILRDIFLRSGAGGGGNKKMKFVSMIMTMLSVGDFVSSFVAHFLGSWMVPKGLVYLASGNTATCTAQGALGNLFGHLAVGANISLALTYVLMVRYGWRESDFQNRRWVKVVLLGHPILTGVAFNIPILLDNAYNYTGLHQCFIASSPLGCSGASCERGRNAQVLSKWGATFPLIIKNVIVIVLVFVLFWTVLQTERQNDRYLSDGQGLNRKQSIRTGWQGIWYVGAFIMTYIPWYIIMGFNYRSKPIPYWLLVWTVTVIGLQGFFNALVYFRPNYLSNRDDYGMRDSMSLVLNLTSKESLRLRDSQHMCIDKRTSNSMMGAATTLTSERSSPFSNDDNNISKALEQNEEHTDNNNNKNEPRDSLALRSIDGVDGEIVAGENNSA